MNNTVEKEIDANVVYIRAWLLAKKRCHKPTVLSVLRALERACAKEEYIQVIISHLKLSLNNLSKVPRGCWFAGSDKWISLLTAFDIGHQISDHRSMVKGDLSCGDKIVLLAQVQFIRSLVRKYYVDLNNQSEKYIQECLPIFISNHLTYSNIWVWKGLVSCITMCLQLILLHVSICTRK